MKLKLTSLVSAFILLMVVCTGPAAAQVHMVKSTSPDSAKTTISCGATDTAGYSLFDATAQVSMAYFVGGANAAVALYGSGGTYTASATIETAPTSSGPWFDITSGTPITSLTTTGGSIWTLPNPTLWVRVNDVSNTANGFKACLFGYRPSNLNKVY